MVTTPTTQDFPPRLFLFSLVFFDISFYLVIPGVDVGGLLSGTILVSVFSSASCLLVTSPEWQEVFFLFPFFKMYLMDIKERL